MTTQPTGFVYGVNGPVVRIRGGNSTDLRMSEMVEVGHNRLMGEIISINREETAAQVFEDTSMLSSGEPVYATDRPLSITLGPGLVGNIFDGIGRPLRDIEAAVGAFITKGFRQDVDASSDKKKWAVKMLAEEGQTVVSGQIVAEIVETPAIINKVMIPPEISGTVKSAAKDGEYNANDVLLTVIDANNIAHEITMTQRWHVRTRRPVKEFMRAETPLITGQRVIDALFPVAKGGMAALPGGFGAGKTMLQHQLAKWSDADIIVYIGCGERGNEMTQVLEDFSKLTDPKTGAKLMDRTVLIANTSNMPVAAREASVYTGVTIAEYFRDMGYHTAIMADSTSRWAEALRELSGRLEEMPAEEGFPAYLVSKLAGFYERAGFVKTLGGNEGSITIIGAVSPQGADFSEPVTMQTKRFVRSFWTLDKNLAYARHFPAVQWLTSYSEYLDNLEDWYNEHVGREFLNYRAEIIKLLNEESELMEIVKLVGADILPEGQKLTLEISRVIRLGFVQQNAYTSDSFTPFEKQMKMMGVILYLYEKCRDLASKSHPVGEMRKTGIFDKIIAIKHNVGNNDEDIASIDNYRNLIDEFHDGFKDK